MNAKEWFDWASNQNRTPNPFNDPDITSDRFIASSHLLAAECAKLEAALRASREFIRSHCEEGFLAPQETYQDLFDQIDAALEAQP